MVAKISGRAEKILRETQAPYLLKEERELLARFIARLESECRDSIRRVILYGSKARGNADEESDTDLLVIVSDDDAAKRIWRIEDDFKSETFATISVLIATEENYRRMQYLKTPLYVNIRRDNVELWDESARTIEEREVLLDFVEGEFRQMNKATRELIQQYVDTTHSFWKQAMHLKQGGFLQGAVSRAYYAVFHAASAALFAVNIVRGKHSGVEAAISQFLVKPGLIEPEYHEIYGRLMKGRTDVDYGGERDEVTRAPKFILPSDAEAEQMLADAERFIARMEQFLRARGAMD
ncbi:MAG: HEPN domain-containing protein [Chloroflexi bacterium]|nr:HEPN domain-containing protein [Chloroflexota bacterium]